MFGGTGDPWRKRARTVASETPSGHSHYARQGHHQAQSDGERMSRWISWVLKAGHTELNISVAEGWVRLAPPAEAAARRFLIHKGLDEDTLTEFLNITDAEGRFEISRDGFLRKVTRRHRHVIQNIPDNNPMFGNGENNDDIPMFGGGGRSSMFNGGENFNLRTSSFGNVQQPGNGNGSSSRDELADVVDTTATAMDEGHVADDNDVLGAWDAVGDAIDTARTAVDEAQVALDVLKHRLNELASGQ